MAIKKKPCNCGKKKQYGIAYVQSSNPSDKLLNKIDDWLEDGKIVYLQSGVPPCIPTPGHPCPKT